MYFRSRRQRFFTALFSLSVFVMSSLPVKAQDIVTSSDISGGSSVFVFRGNSRAKQSKPAYQTIARRSDSQKAFSRKKLVSQSTTIAKAIQKTRPTKRIDAQELKRIEPQIARMKKEEASLIFAGAGEYYLERDDTEKGLEFFREAIQLDDKNKFAILGLSDASARKGNELLEQEKFDKAILFFEDALKYNDKNATAYAGLAEAQDETGEKDKSVANYEKALGYDSKLTELYTPLGVAYYQKGEIDKAKTYLTKAMASDADNSETQYFLGSILYKETKYSEALTAVQRSLKNDSENADAHYLLASIYDKLDRENDAIVEYNKSVTLNPKLAGAWFDLGAAYYNQENYKESVKAYEMAVKLDNRNWQAHLNLAEAYWQSGDFNKAEGSYNLALTFIQRTNEVSVQEKADIYNKFGWTLGQQCAASMRISGQCLKWNAMVDKFQKAVDLVPDAINYSNLGWAYFNQGHLDAIMKREGGGRERLLKAKDALENAVRQNPKFVEAPLMNLGGTLIDLGDYSGAIEALKRVTEKRSDWQNADYMLGVAYRKNNDFKNAADALGKAVKKDPNYVIALTWLGETQLKLDKKNETSKIIARLKKIGTPDALREAQKLDGLMKSPFK